MNLRIIIFVLVLLSVLSTSIGGYIYYSSLQESSLEAAHSEADEKAKDIANNIDLGLAEYQKSVEALSGINVIKQSLHKKDPDSLKKANAILDHFYSALSVSVCYLMDDNGDTIASSNRNSPKSFVGKNYAFRPYFQKAINGNPSIYMALGVTSGLRGIYYAYPVYGEDQNNPSGVVVIKTSVMSVENQLFRHNFEGTVSLTDAHGVVFASSNKDWLYRSLWRLKEKEISEVSRSRQFGKGPWDWVGIEKKDDYHGADKSGKKYRIHKKDLNNYQGWQVIYLHDNNKAFERVTFPLMKSSGYIIFSLCLLIGVSAALLFRLARKDIVKRERAESALREGERRYRSLYEDTPAMLHSIDSGGRIISVSKYWLETLGYDLNEVIGRKSSEFLTEASRHHAETEVLPVFFKTGYCKNVSYQYLKKNGEVLDILLSAISERDQAGNVARSFAVLLDITEQKKLEAQLLHAQKMESIGTLAGGVAHDFNNILTAVMGFTSILKRRISEDDPLRIYVEQIQIAAEKAADLTADLLTFSRKQRTNPVYVNLNSLIRKSEKFLLRIIREDINLSSIYADNELNVFVDLNQIEQVLVNLITNARDAMPTGGSLTLTTEAGIIDSEFIKSNGYGEPGEYAVIQVSDTGTGMDDKIKNKIFEPFFTTKEVDKGTGLGLSIVYGIIKQHNGYINITSGPREGTTFYIYLPIINNPEEQEVFEKPSNTDAPFYGKGTILVAEDDEMIRNITTSVLEEFGYTVISAEDGEDAINKFSRNRDNIDFLILDVIMPKKNGRDVYKEIIKSKPDIKGFFLSGYSDDIIPQSDIIEWGLEVVSKPITPEDLLRKIRETLNPQ